MVLSDADLRALAAAVERLERPGFAGRMAALAARPAGLVARALPGPAAGLIASAAERALARALEVALFSLRDKGFVGRRLAGGRLGRARALHSALASASGAVGGAFGLAALVIELPVSTMIMLRAIAAIAQQEGEELATPETGLACLQVFGLGASATPVGSGAEAGYFAVRALLASGLAEAGAIIANPGAASGGTAAALRALAPVAARFGAVVSEKLAAQAVPVVGAVAGAAVNLAFIEHFQDLARGHFTIRRLERAYGEEIVRGEYDRLKSGILGA
jgi:EcsC protein family